MRMDRDVVHPLAFDDHLGFCQRGEQLPVEQLIAHLPGKRFAVAMLPGGAGFNAQRFHEQSRPIGAQLAGKLPRYIADNDSERHTLRIHGQMYSGVGPLLSGSSLDCRPWRLPRADVTMAGVDHQPFMVWLIK